MNFFETKNYVFYWASHQDWGKVFDCLANHPQFIENILFHQDLNHPKKWYLMNHALNQKNMSAITNLFQYHPETVPCAILHAVQLNIGCWDQIFFAIKNQIFNAETKLIVNYRACYLHQYAKSQGMINEFNQACREALKSIDSSDEESDGNYLEELLKEISEFSCIDEENFDLEKSCQINHLLNPFEPHYSQWHPIILPHPPCIAPIQDTTAIPSTNSTSISNSHDLNSTAKPITPCYNKKSNQGYNGKKKGQQKFYRPKQNIN